jgi:pyruvate-formate lyase-activating enzyme
VDQFRKPAIVQNEFKENQQFAGLRKSAKRYPMMIVLSTVYPCNFGCPNCPYSEGNSDLRVAYKSEGGDYLPEQLWNRIADESGPHGTWLRCTGGGEPMMHPQMTNMISYAKSKGCRIWLNTNGSLFGPNAVGRKKLEALINAGVDIIEFSMDAGDAETYQKVRPPLKGKVSDPDKRWQDQLSNIKFALETRLKLKKTTRVVVSIIRQKLIVGTQAISNLIPTKKTALLFLPEGEFHELGILFIQYLLKNRGIGVLYLGTNIPLEDVDYVVKYKAPDFIYTHLTSVSNLFSFDRFIQQSQKRFNLTPLIISGRLASLYDKSIPPHVHLKKSLQEVTAFITELA